MQRRLAFTGLVGVVASIAIASSGFAAGKTTHPPTAATSTTATTTAATSPPPPTSTPPKKGGGTVACTPDAKHSAAPAVGSTTDVPAAEGGKASVKRTAQTALEITNAAPSSGWNDIVFTPSGQSVRVKFIDNANQRHFVRLAVTLNNSGSEIHVRVTSCR